MISIYTRTNNILKKEFWKWFIKKKILRRYSGPDAVVESLLLGLNELHIPFEMNPLKPKYDLVHVLSGIEILKEAIEKREQGTIKTLIAGPSLVKTPYESNNIIQNKNIDLLLFPSRWTRDFYVSLVPELNNKIKIWPAGVTIPSEISSKQNVLVYKKNISDEIFEKIIRILENKKVKYDVVKYGEHNKKQYQDELRKATLLIYLQTTESQGIALQEAWSFDIPTMVLRNHTWTDGTYSWSDDKISAPYLNDDNGLFFTLENFDQEFTKIMNNDYKFTPRQYCIDHLSNLASTKIYIDIIKQHVK
jgi:hypothetical protein